MEWIHIGDNVRHVNGVEGVVQFVYKPTGTNRMSIRLTNGFYAPFGEFTLIK